MSSIYQINKGVSKPIVFKGLKAQYIAYLAIGLVLLLIGFAILYICGLTLWIILPVILGLGIALFFTVFRLSHRYGEHGLMKHFARKQLPEHLKFRSRKLFINLKKQDHGYRN
jgi:cell division protein FtsW (lipid II flippase)